MTSHRNCGSVGQQEKVFIVFGSLGVFGYIGHLARKVFADSLLFPVALCGVGCLIIYFGIQYQRNSKKIEEKLRNSNERLESKVKERTAELARARELGVTVIDEDKFLEMLGG